MAKASTMDLVVGVILIIVGVLFLMGEVGIPFLPQILAIVALVVGILMLMGKMRGPQWLGIALVVVAVLVLATPWLDFLAGTVASVINIVVGIVLIVIGVLKVMGRM